MSELPDEGADTAYATGVPAHLRGVADVHWPGER